MPLILASLVFAAALAALPSTEPPEITQSELEEYQAYISAQTQKRRRSSGFESITAEQEVERERNRVSGDSDSDGFGRDWQEGEREKRECVEMFRNYTIGGGDECGCSMNQSGETRKRIRRSRSALLSKREILAVSESFSKPLERGRTMTRTSFPGPQSQSHFQSTSSASSLSPDGRYSISSHNSHRRRSSSVPVDIASFREKKYMEITPTSFPSPASTISGKSEYESF